MASIAEAVPIEILTEIFQLVQNDCRRDFRRNNERFLHDRLNELAFFSEPFMPPRRTERRQFTRFRLVSRSWKGVADTFFFKDMGIVITTDNERRVGYYSRRYRFLDLVFGGGYTHLIRNIYLELDLYDYDRLEGPFEKSKDSALLPYTDLVCDLLIQHSDLRRQLFIQISHPNYCEDEFHTNIITDKIMNALWKLPTQCHVELSLLNEKSLDKWARNFERNLAARFSRLLSHHLSSLEISINWPVSRTFFASLRCTKKLYLSLNLRKIWTGDLADETATGIDMMPALEDLHLDGIPVSRVPKTLRRVSLNAPEDYFPDPEFFVSLCQINELEDLRLSFETQNVHCIQSTFSQTQLAQITQGHLPNLRVLQIYTTLRVSRLLGLFCSQLLRICSSLQELNLYGVSLTNEIILNTATSSLQKISLNGHTMISFTAAEIFAGLAEPAEQIQWSTLSSLFQRNPNITTLQLAFDLRLPPLTFTDIVKVSKTCPRLTYIWMYATIMDDDEIDMIMEDESSVYKLRWLYSRSTATENKAVKRVLEYMCKDSRDRDVFILNLQSFRRLKDVARNTGQRKKRR
jgi:hypothetical protein